MKRTTVGLILLLATLANAVDPPAGTDAWTVTTGKRFVLRVQDRSQDTPGLSADLEAFYVALAAEFDVKPPQVEPVPVYVFANRAAFEDYVVGQDQPRTLVGWCHIGVNGAFLVTYSRDFGPHDSVRVTLKHEATHLFLFRNVPDAPKLPGWLNEGLAVYYSHARLVEDGSLAVDIPTGELHWIQGALKVGTAKPFGKLLSQHNRHPAGLASAQSWSVVCWLLGPERKNRKTFRRYLFTAGAANDPVKHFGKVFRKSARRADREWRRYVLALRAEPKARRSTRP